MTIGDVVRLYHRAPLDSSVTLVSVMTKGGTLNARTTDARSSSDSMKSKLELAEFRGGRPDGWQVRVTIDELEWKTICRTRIWIGSKLPRHLLRRR